MGKAVRHERSPVTRSPRNASGPSRVSGGTAPRPRPATEPLAAALLALSCLSLSAFLAADRATADPAPGERQGGPTRDGLTVPAGTPIVAALQDTLSTGQAREGESFVASVVRPVTGPAGVAVPRGAGVYLTALRLRPSRNLTEPTVVRLRFDSLRVRGGVHPIRATLVRARTSKVSRTSVVWSILWIALAAAAGGGVGHWLTGGRGSLTGAALAAVAAAVFIMATQDVDAVLPAGAEIELHLDEAVEVAPPE